MKQATHPVQVSPCRIQHVFIPCQRAVACLLRRGRPKRGRKKKFGSTGLNVNGRIFAMVARSRLVLKLWKARGRPRGVRRGRVLRSGHGRAMKQWVSLVRTMLPWADLVKEAHEYVRGTRRWDRLDSLTTCRCVQATPTCGEPPWWPVAAMARNLFSQNIQPRNIPATLPVLSRWLRRSCRPPNRFGAAGHIAHHVRSARLVRESSFLHGST